MQNIAKLVNEYLLALPKFPVTVIYNDLFPEAQKDSLLCRHDPSTAAEKRYADGSRRGIQNFSYIARCKDAKNCRSWLQTVIDSLDQKEIVVSEAVTIECEAVTLPQFISSSEDQKQTIYTASVKVEFYEDAKGNI